MHKLFFTIIVLFCLSACSTDEALKQISEMFFTPTPITSVKTLVDNVAGFAFDYPADWSVSGSPDAQSTNYSFTLLSFEPDPNSPSEGRALPNETHLDIFVFQNPSDLDAAQKSSIEGVTDLIQEKWQLSTTVQATWVHGTFPPAGDVGGGEAEMLFTVINGRGVLMDCSGDTTPCKTVMHSLRLLTPDSQP